jgi:hypothetical protein
VRHLGGDAAVLSAFGPMPGVVNDAAMTVLEPRNTLAAFAAHGPLIAPGGDKAWLPRLVWGSLSEPSVFAQAAHPQPNS